VSHLSPAPRRRSPLGVLAAACAAGVLLAAPGSAAAAGPYVFCDRDFPAYDTCVSGGYQFPTEVQARDLNGSNRVCATQKYGSTASSTNQYDYACANYLAARLNPSNYGGYPAVHNGESWSQIMRGQFYL
jgi:hypothetical protein